MTYIDRKNNGNDELFRNLNSNHVNIKLALEENSGKFSDTKIISKNNTKFQLRCLQSFLFIGVPKS